MCIRDRIIPDPIIGNQQINNVTVVKIKKAGSFSVLPPLNASQTYEIVLYRNNNPNNDLIYYEFGQQFYVQNPGLVNRQHYGLIQNQQIDIGFPAEFNFYDGDVYFKSRDTIPGPIGNPVGNYFVLDRNVAEDYISAVSSISGRPNIIDENARRAYYGTLVRFGQAYQPNTNINGLPRFFSTNFDEYDFSYGDIMRLRTRDKFIRVFQKLKVGMVPLFQQMVKNQGSENLVISDRLLNPIQYYMGDVGIGDNPESLASYNYADYFTSNIKGAICRVSQDGVSFLSIEKKINSWANAQVGDLEPRFMVGVFDQRLSNYILALSASNNNPEVTIVFDQEYNNFETFLTMYPEMMCSLGVTLMSWKDGIPYVHNDSPYNTWYGLPAADSSITPIFYGDNPYQKKTFTNISEVASTVWDIPTMKTDLYSYGTTRQNSNLVDSDFQQLEGTYEAAILRDTNSIGGILGGDSIKGKYLIPTIRKTSASSLVILNIVSCRYIDSPLTTR